MTHPAGFATILPTVQDLSEQILAARQKGLGLTRAQAALRFGVSVRQLARYERGESPIPLTLAIALADALGIALDALIGRELALDLAVEVNGRRFTLSAADPGPVAADPAPAVDARIAEAVAVVQEARAGAPRRSGRSGSHRPIA